VGTGVPGDPRTWDHTVSHTDELSHTHTHTHTHRQNMNSSGAIAGVGHSSDRSIWSFVVFGPFASLISASVLKAKASQSPPSLCSHSLSPSLSIL